MKFPIPISKTTLAGVLGGFLAAFGPGIGARLQGDLSQPPITTSGVLTGLALVALGKLAQDQTKAGK